MKTVPTLAIIGLLTSLTAATAWSQTARSGMYQIQLSATPTQLPADGQSLSRLRVDLRTQSGAAVPDGTPFVAHTDNGLLSLSNVGRASSLNGRTSGGFAILNVSSSTPGTATVTVQAADSRNVAYIDFLPEGEVGSGEARVADVSGGWVGYSMEMQVIEARDRARVRLGKVTIETGGVLQISVENLTLRAQDVVIRRGDLQLKGEDLYYDLATKRGVVRRFGEERLERVYFDSIGLRPSDTTWEIPDDAFKLDKREADSWLVARSISLFLREKVVLRNAALWIQEQKVFTFPPYWIIGLPGYTGADNSQAFGLSSSGGLAVDFPFFYRVTDRATGAIKIQRGAAASSVTSRDGWSLAISEEYRNGAGREGCLEVGGIPRSDWGVTWRDSRPMWGNGFGYFNIALPDHRSLFADTNVYRYSGGGRLSMRAYYDEPVDYDATYGLISDWLMDPRGIGDHNVSYRLGTSLGWQRYSGDSESVFTNSLYSELNLGDRRMGKKTRVQPMITNTFSWDTSGYQSNSLRGELRFDHEIHRNFNLGLDYSAELRNGSADGTQDGWSQMLGFDLRANHAAKWLTYLNSTYEIEDGDLYAYMSFDYYLNPKWRWGLNATYYDFATGAYDDVEFSLGRVFGDREISLNYSTDSGRVYLSLGGFGLR